MNNDWPDKLRQKLEDFQSTEIPEGLWEGIEQGLNDRKPAIVPWRRWAVAACAALLLAGVGTLWLMHQNTEVPVAQQADSTLVTPIAAPSISSPIAQQDTAVGTPLPGVIRHRNKLQIAKQEPSTDETILEQDLAEVVLPDSTARVSNEAEAQKQAYGQTSIKTPQNKTIKRQPVLHNNKERNCSVKLYTSQMATDSDHGMAGYLALSETGMPNHEQPAMLPGLWSEMDHVEYANLHAGDEPVTDAHHRQPVRVGVSVGYDINRRWSVNAGLCYTRLRSTLQSGSEHSFYDNDQRINYLGIPLGVNYNFLHKRHIRLYATAGGMMEVGVDGQVTVHTVAQNKLMSSETHELEDIPLQWSLTAGAGVEYDIVGGLGIYAEPGVSYYLPTHGDISTIYSAHPVNLNLQVGLRWNFGK